MATPHTPTQSDAILKDWYTDDKMKELSFGENTFLAMVRKERGQNANGRRYVQPIEFAHPGGASADYATAMTNGTASQYEDFIIPRKKQYQRVQVEHELLFASDDKRGSFQKAMNEFDRGFKGLGEKLGRRLFRTQGGAMAQLANSTTNTNVGTLSDKATAFAFQIGDKIQFSTTDGTGSLLDSGDVCTIASVQLEDGTVTFNENIGTQIAGATTTMFLFQHGDYNACLAGLESWMPVDNRTTALATSFNSVTRSVAPEYLGGVYMDGTSMGGLDEVIIKLVGKVQKYGGKTSHIFANPESLSDLELLSNSKMRIVAEVNSKIIGDTGDVLVGFSGYKAIVAGRTVKVYSDRNCPANRLYALQLDTWTLWHTGKFINWLGEEYTGSRLQPSQNEDCAEARLGAYMNVGCSAPGWNGVAKINPPTT
jgi:hypothetical protein